MIDPESSNLVDTGLQAENRPHYPPSLIPLAVNQISYEEGLHFTNYEYINTRSRQVEEGLFIPDRDYFLFNQLKH